MEEIFFHNLPKTLPPGKIGFAIFWIFFRPLMLTIIAKNINILMQKLLIIQYTKEIILLLLIKGKNMVSQTEWVLSVMMEFLVLFIQQVKITH